MDNHETLMRLAQQVRTAITEGENTAEKVGRVLTGILEKIEIEELARVFLRKDRDDETVFLVKFFNGIETGLYIEGENGAKIDLAGNAELHTLVARVKAVAKELEVTDKATTLNLLVKNLAEIHNLDVDNLATLFRTVVKDYVRSENFVPGFTGEGMKLEKALSGDWEMELDRLTIRKTLRVFELLISKIRAVNGGLVVSPANGKIKEVTEPGDEPGLYRLTIDGDTHFVPGDLVRCQVFTGNQLKHYWVPVKRVNEDSIFVAKADFPEDTYPEAGDEIVLMGNVSDTTRQGCLFLSATDDGKPRIQVLNGINSPSLVGKNRTIIGCLDGIEDTYFNEHQPQGYGLYSDNAYLRGDFQLRTGEDVRTTFEIIQGMLRSAIQTVTHNITEEDNYFTNAWFTRGMKGWEHESNIDLYSYEDLLIDIGTNFLSNKNSLSEVVEYDARHMLRLKDGFIRQKNELIRKPAENTPMYLNFRYKCMAPGKLTIGFDDRTEGMEFPIREYDIISGSEYQTFEVNGMWNGLGDFFMSFTGDIYIELLNFSNNPLDDYKRTISTRFEQTDEKIEAVATDINKVNDTISEAGWITKADGNTLWATKETVEDLTGTVAKHTSEIKNTPGLISAEVESRINGVKEDLNNTGINITHRNITLTADKTNIRDNAGNEIALFTTVDGKPVIKAENIDVDNLSTRKLETSIDGARITIDPDSKSLKMYDFLNQEVLVLKFQSESPGRPAMPQIKVSGINLDGKREAETVIRSGAISMYTSSTANYLGKELSLDIGPTGLSFYENGILTKSINYK